ncbi:DUF4279 domain-containing protein [Phytomonospora endophytica]|uniref:DUF4279 domain-containing protein n=1 Tax=Phytomonospora endophytica TaxID=714109 RepID=A0A841FMC5_9ACTN|nr:DUF4279 domain-containing protein [Phytomonospora endophytica]MBB6033759.1 hypothetical protein [Phytomonospora endophytica]GIG64724.1 hypothetical protein Pen01_10190 [Phytomonospora endophytica]
MPEDVTVDAFEPSTKWSAGSILITSRTVSPDEISERLRLLPDEQFERGSLTSPRNPSSARRDSNLWARKSGLGSDADLAEHVGALVQLVTGCRDELRLLSVDCDLKLFLGFSSDNGQGGCVLPAPLLAEIGALGFDVVFDLYHPPEVSGAWTW